MYSHFMSPKQLTVTKKSLAWETISNGEKVELLCQESPESSLQLAT